MMGGTIAVDSRPGEGSTFPVTLESATSPRRTGHIPPAMTPPGHGRRSWPRRRCSTSRTTRPNVRVVEQLLKLRPEWKLVHAALGSLGVELAEAHRPDLILLDLHLPDLSGHEVLRGHPRPTPATAPTPSSSSPPTRARAWPTGCASRRDWLPDQAARHRPGPATPRRGRLRRKRSAAPMTGQLASYSGMRVLVVDDNASNVALMAALAARAGSGADPHRDRRPAGAAPAGRETIRTWYCSICTCPTSTAIPCSSQIQRFAAGSYLPVLVLTADTTTAARDRALAPGCAGLPHQAGRRRRSDAAHRQSAADPAAARRAAPVRGARRRDERGRRWTDHSERPRANRGVLREHLTARCTSRSST